MLAITATVSIPVWLLFVGGVVLACVVASLLIGPAEPASGIFPIPDLVTPLIHFAAWTTILVVALIAAVVWQAWR